MTASRLRSFRQGDLAEGIGLQMLRRFAAVAPVPREEDFGIDAICTLLRADDRKLLAENTFAVQVKAISNEPLEMNEASCIWLRQLDIPFFLLMVDLKQAAASLYSYEWAVIGPADIAISPGSRLIYVDRPDRYSTEAPHIIFNESGDVDMRLRWLGPPVTSFALADLVNEERIGRLYSLLKPWCEQVAQSIYLRRHEIESRLSWKTDTPPERTALSIYTRPGQLVEVLAEMMPLILKLEMALQSVPGNSFATTFPELETLKRRANELGVPGFSKGRQ